ncbi:MAG: hypothetical protein KatS3mg028_1363 [Bacteroidia bacterium]|nr:MAG: hypothetical protein KatS3mg028_1363 [Bacteroidia bacterium]
MKRQLTLLLFLFSMMLFSQTKLDTLWQNLKTARHDTTVYNAYMALGNYFQYSNPDTAIYFHTQAEKVAEKIPGEDGELKKADALLAKGWDYFIKSEYQTAQALFDSAMKIVEKHLENEVEPIRIKAKKIYSACLESSANIHLAQGDYAKALENYFKALSINEEVGNKQGQAINLGNIGAVYHEQGDYAKALECYFKALSIHEKIDNRQGQAANLGNIGIVYEEQGDYAKALKYYFKALPINEEIGNKQGQAINLGNIGGVYYEQGDYEKALEYSFKSLSIYEEIGDKQGQATNLGNIGIVFLARGDYAQALEYHFKALSIYEEIDHKRGQAINLGNIGSTYLRLKQYQKAEEYLKKAELLNKELGTLYYLQNALSDLSSLYEQTGKYKLALEYYKEYTQVKDSLNNEENRKALQTMELKYQYEKEQALKEKEHQKQLEIQRKEKERQKVISYAIGSGLVLVLIFSLVIFNRLQITRKQKRIIEEQKQQVELQKQLVEQKNKEITDSIIYAKRIQEAILPSESKWQALLPDSFVFYLPKDIVAGDFYWLEETDDYIFVAAADCTGHGVPGAMVSVVCSNALTKSVLEEKMIDTDKILNRTKEIVTEKLSASEKHIQDGMDVALVRISKKNIQQIQFSGANRPLLIVGREGMREIKGDKQPVGLDDRSGMFTAKEMELKPGEEIFMYTDGFADQFGGEKGQKDGQPAVQRDIAGDLSLVMSGTASKDKRIFYSVETKRRATGRCDGGGDKGLKCYVRKIYGKIQLDFFNQ